MEGTSKTPEKHARQTGWKSLQFVHFTVGGCSYDSFTKKQHQQKQNQKHKKKNGQHLHICTSCSCLTPSKLDLRELLDRVGVQHHRRKRTAKLPIFPTITSTRRRAHRRRVTANPAHLCRRKPPHANTKVVAAVEAVSGKTRGGGGCLLKHSRRL